MKNIYIYLAIALAVLAFSACSNGDDGTEGNPSSSSKGGSKQGVCYIPNVPDARDLKMCAEGITESLTKADCDELSYETGYTANYQNSCPSGQKLKCLVEDENGNGAGYFYIYGQVITDLDFTCATFGYADADGGGSRPSSASKPSSSSANSSLNSGVCYLDEYGFRYCYESKNGTITRSECTSEGGNLMVSCPSGQKLKCYDDFYDEIYYLYDTETYETCEDYDMVPANNSSSSRPSSSSASKPSSNSNSGSGACYFDYDDGDGECYEFTTETITRYECMDEGGTFMASCPSGQQLKCVDYDLIGYYYGQMWVGQTCNSLGW